MTISQFHAEQLADVEYQLRAVFEGITDQQWNQKATEVSMSPAETAVHLAECYTAFLASAEGKEHSWGTYKEDDLSPANLHSTMFALRSKAVNIAISSEDPKVHKNAAAFITLHDAYHVGQMVTLRLALGDFDPYSIYNH